LPDGVSGCLKEWRSSGIYARQTPATQNVGHLCPTCKLRGNDGVFCGSGFCKGFGLSAFSGSLNAPKGRVVSFLRTVRDCAVITQSLQSHPAEPFQAA
jgi:hypothetical protein